METVIVFLEQYMSYGMISISLVAAWCLSNNKTILGRRLGSTAAILFMIYGAITVQPAFIIGEFIFLYIYVSADIKFNRKRARYREKSNTDDETIAKMERIINKANELEKKILKTRIGNMTTYKLNKRTLYQKQLYSLLKMGSQIETGKGDDD